jgi:hypothetical protein
VVVLFTLCSCNILADWRDRQIKASHTAGRSLKPIEPPAVPIVVPDNVLETLPADKSFTFLNYAKSGDKVSLKAISPWDAETTSLWMLARLKELGYDSGDNPSRILEGCDFFGEMGVRYDSIWTRVDLNAAEQCLIEIETRER